MDKYEFLKQAKAAVKNGNDLKYTWEKRKSALEKTRAKEEKEEEEEKKQKQTVNGDIIKNLTNTKTARGLKSEKRTKTESVPERYGIEPEKFTYDDLNKWADKHNYTMHINTSTLSPYYEPKREGGFLGIGGKKLSNEQEDNDIKVLEELAKNNSRKKTAETDYGAGMSAISGFADGLTFGGASKLSEMKAKKLYNEAGLDKEEFVSPKEIWKKTESEHKTANTIGNISGSVVSLYTLGEAVGTATKAVPWIAKSPAWVQSAINNGITFAVSGGAETAFDGGNFEEVVKSTAINLVGGTVGGGVSGKVGSIGEKLLFDKGLQHKIIPEMIRVGASSAAFASGKTASTYLLYPKDYRPTAEEIAKDITTAFAFGAISSGINTIKTTSQNKKYLDDIYRKMATDYESMAKATINGKNDAIGKRKFAKNVIAYGDIMEAYLTGKEYNTTINGETYSFSPNKVRLVGQDKYVKSILNELNTVRNSANAVLNGVEASNVSAASSSANVTNNSGNSAGAVAQAANKAAHASAPAVSDSAAISGTAAISQKSTPDTTDTNKTSYANAEASRTANDTIKKLENTLEEKGLDEATRREIVSSASKIEKAVESSGTSFARIADGIEQITTSAAEKINRATGANDAYRKIYAENFKVISSEEALKNPELVRAYANAYAQGLKSANPEKYNSIMLSFDGEDLSSQLADTVMNGLNVPETAENFWQYRTAAIEIKNIILGADAQIERIRNAVYGKKITLTRTGDFYEAHGAEAWELAKKLNLNTTEQTVNGEKTLTVKFPASVLEQYKATLGKEYNLVVKDTPITAVLEGDTAKHDDVEKTSTKKTNELFKKLTDSIPLLENDTIVYTATGNEFAVGKKELSQQVYEYFESLGGIVHRKNFGDVAINDKGVDSSIAHGMGRAKAIAFASVPSVIEKGRQIDFAENRKGRNYDSYVFAAPIQIGAQRAYVAVVVTKSNTDNRYYLHEVSDNEGNIITIKKDDVSFKSKSEATNDSSSLGETSSNGIISQNNAGVNSDENKTPYEIMDDFGLTYDEQHAILEYKSSGSYTLNDDLRNGETLSSAEEMQKKNANSALDKFPKYIGVVYRNIGFSTAKKFVAFLDEHIGKTSITYPAFTSASKSTDGYTVEAPYTAHYEIESTNGRDVSAIGIEAEKEILFKTDTSFEFSIIEQTDNYISLKMKEVTGNGESKPYGAFQDRGERPTAGRNATGFDNSGERKKVYTGIDTVRGRSSVYDEIYNGAPVSDGRRVESGSKPQNVGNNAEIRNDSERERLLSGVNISSSDSIISAVHGTLKPKISENTALMNALINKFGGDGISGLASEIEAYYGKNNTLDDFESLFTDGGRSVYEALGGNGLEDIKYSESESEELSNGQAGNNLLSGNGGRAIDESAGEQAERISSYKQKIRGKATSERKITARELALKGYTEEVIDGVHKYTVINENGYNDDMCSITAEAKAYGKDVGFFVGNAIRKFDGRRDYKIDGIKLADNKILIRYDGTYSPQALLMHELVHTEWDNPEMQEAKDNILSDLSENDRREILQNGRYKDYMELYNGDEDAVWEEFVADVFADMNVYTDSYVDTVVDYWYGNEQIDSYSPSEYTRSTDAGGNDGNEYSLSGNSFNIPYNEKRQLDDYVLRKNHGADTFKRIDCKEIGNNFYVWKNNSKTDYTVISMTEIDGNEDLIAERRKELKNGNLGIGKKHNVSYEGRNRNGRGSNNMLNAAYQRRKSANGNGGISSEQSESDKRRYIAESGGDTQTKYALNTDGENAEFWKEWFDKAKEYGVIPKGENPTRNIAVPKKITSDKVVSRFARTLLEAGVTPDWAVSEFEKAILDGKMTHEVITDKRTLDNVKSEIEKLGFEEALNHWNVLSKRGKIGKKELALGMELYNQCVTNKDTHNAMKIAADLAAEATRAGQTLQACRLLKLMSPDGQLYYLENSIQKMNEEFRRKLGKKFKDIELDEKLMDKFFNGKDEESRNAAYDEICQDIADRIPSTLLDKWNSWRYLAMLGNPRTHIRNLVGNAAFIPSVRIKNYVGAFIETAARIEPEKRTHSARKSKKAIEFAKNDAIKMKNVLMGGKGKYAVMNEIESKRTIFKTKPLEYVRKKNFDLLEAEDWLFLRPHYVDALARLITVRKIDTDNISTETLDVLRGYAVNEAKAATYRDANALAEGLNKLQRRMERSEHKSIRAASVAIEGPFPFKGTPMNMVKQGVNYSPIGLLNGLVELGKKHSGYDISTDKIIDNIAKGITGTGVLLLGYWLRSLGFLVGGGDKSKKEKEFDKMTGEQTYAIRIPGRFSYTFDWALPSNLSLFIGAMLYDLTKDDFKFRDVVDALSTVAEPVLGLSVFSGVNDLIETADYGESEPMVSLLSSMAFSYIMQAFPTLFGQISRIKDGTKREYYYTDRNSNIPKALQRLIGQASSKIPLMSYLFEPSVDEWGREETYGNLTERILENTVSPGYYAEENYTKVDREIKTLYNRTGEGSVLPRNQTSSFTENNVRYYMNAKEYTEAKRIRGQRSFELISELIEDKKKVKLRDGESNKIYEKVYSQMSDAEKVKAVTKCYDEAGEEAKEKILEKMKSKKK